MRAHRARGFMGLLASYIQENSETRQGTRGQVKNPSKGVPKGQKKAALQIPVFFLGMSLYLARIPRVFFMSRVFSRARAPRPLPERPEASTTAYYAAPLPTPTHITLHTRARPHKYYCAEV